MLLHIFFAASLGSETLRKRIFSIYRALEFELSMHILHIFAYFRSQGIFAYLVHILLFLVHILLFFVKIFNF
jgi:hypothetical protein